MTFKTKALFCLLFFCLCMRVPFASPICDMQHRVLCLQQLKSELERLGVKIDYYNRVQDWGNAPFTTLTNFFYMNNGSKTYLTINDVYGYINASRFAGQYHSSGLASAVNSMFSGPNAHTQYFIQPQNSKTHSHQNSNATGGKQPSVFHSNQSSGSANGRYHVVTKFKDDVDINHENINDYFVPHHAGDQREGAVTSHVIDSKKGMWWCALSGLRKRTFINEHGNKQVHGHSETLSFNNDIVNNIPGQHLVESSRCLISIKH